VKPSVEDFTWYSPAKDREDKELNKNKINKIRKYFDIYVFLSSKIVITNINNLLR
jgi:hypothetical protein